MKFTLDWLKTHLETDATLDEIVEALTDIGLEVEEVSNPAAQLASFTVGHVLEAEKHPDADKLRVCKVATGEGEKQIICGAPNARAGIKVVVAAPGDYIPGIDTTIKVGKIRGIDSFGMMLSEREMEISDEHDGIIELDPEAQVGARYIDIVPFDPVVEIAITPNRPDALGVAGIARDLAARGLGKVITPGIEAVTGDGPCPIGVELDLPAAPEACPLFIGRLVRGVKNGPSPKWLQDRLRAIGLRPISILVDITNFMTFDRARPLHVFDADKIEGPITVRMAKPGETLVALDDKTYTFTGTETLVCAASGVESMGGVMGGAATGVSDETVNVFVEAAYFDPVRTAQTGRKHKINSDARYRFERGIDPAFTSEGMEMATQMILDLCGGVASDIVIAGEVPDTARNYQLRNNRVRDLVGLDIPPKEQRRILRALGFDVQEAGEAMQVVVPSWRPDVLGEADLVEEIARIASLTHLRGAPMSRKPGVSEPVMKPLQIREMRTRRTIATLGYNECVTYSFIDETAARLFSDTEPPRLENPISSEMSHMRPALLPGLLRAAARNQARGFNDLALFEVGAAFDGAEPGEQSIMASGIRIGRTGPRDPHLSARNVDLFDAKVDLQAVLSALGAPENPMIRRDGPDYWHPGRHGMICLGQQKILGVFGELHPRILRDLDIKGPAVAFTIYLEAIPFPKSQNAARKALNVSDLQTVERDFAFILDETIDAEAVLKAARGADKALITDVQVFDVFAGPKAAEQMGEGKKSLAITARLQPKDKTLTESEIGEVSNKIVTAIETATGGILRQ